MEITYKKSGHSEKERKISTELLNESFPESDIANVDQYEWQYLQNPIGKGTVIHAFDGEMPVGQTTSIPCKYQVFGKILTVTCTMASCVTPKYQGRGIIRQLRKRIYQIDEGVPFSFSLPNKKNLYIFLKDERYLLIPQQFLIRPLRISNYFKNNLVKKILKPLDTIWKPRMRTSEVMIYNTELNEKFDELFKITSDKSCIRQVRSSEFLNWRYRHNPRRNYTIFIQKDELGNLNGYIIIRIVEIFGHKVGIIMDFIIKNKFNSKNKLITRALEFFWENNVTFAMALCSNGFPEFSLFRKSKFFKCPKFLQPHPLTIVLKKFSEEFKNNSFLDARKWYFMFGDYETF